MKKLARLFAAFLFVVPLMLVGVAQPASAFSDLREQCGQGNYCLMMDINWSGCIAKFAGDDANYADNYCHVGCCISYPLDNIASSVYNNGFPATRDDIRSFRHPNYVEMIWFVPQGNYYSNVDNWCGALPCNDQASSHYWI